MYLVKMAEILAILIHILNIWFNGELTELIIKKHCYSLIFCENFTSTENFTQWQQSSLGRTERVVTHSNVSARIESYQIGNPYLGDRDIMLKHTGSYLNGRLNRNISFYLKLNNRAKMEQIVLECMASQRLVSKLENTKNVLQQLQMVVLVTDCAWCKHPIESWLCSIALTTAVLHVYDEHI